MLVFLNKDAYDKYRLSKEDYELLKDLEKQQKADKEKAEKAAAKKADKKGKKKDDKKESDDKKSSDDKKDSKVKDIKIEFDRLRDRMVRVTPMSSDLGDFTVTNDGETLYFFAEFDKGYDLWKTDLRKQETSLAKKLGYRMRSIQTDKEGKTLYLLGSDGMGKMTISSESIKPIDYSATMKLDAQAERDYMFNYVKQEEAARFYDKGMHGVDWEAMTDAYRKFLTHINNNYDFADLLSEMLGELNVSHTGGRYYPDNNGERTASLGLIYDWDYTGDGLLVSEVVEGGPFDHANTVVKKGTVIEKINGVAITDSTDYTSLLADVAGKKTLVTVKNGKNSTDEVVLPISAGKLSDLLYNRWVKQREADVERLSGGRLGYVHLRSMNDASYRRIYTDLLGKFVDKEGIVIDTRWNGGGRLHEDIETLFSGEKYLTQVIRGVDVCDMPSRRWNKPSIMLQCEANYSNAHGTPWVYKHKGMGKLVGMPVPGTMTSVNWETLQDKSLVFGIPVIGYRTAEGTYLENSQLEPDFKVANDPATVVKGIDSQLEVAVEQLLKQIDSAK
jgi:C-terminal processing protease CtpA/Prc